MRISPKCKTPSLQVGQYTRLYGLGPKQCRSNEFSCNIASAGHYWQNPSLIVAPIIPSVGNPVPLCLIGDPVKPHPNQSGKRDGFCTPQMPLLYIRTLPHSFTGVIASALPRLHHDHHASCAKDPLYWSFGGDMLLVHEVRHVGLTSTSLSLPDCNVFNPIVYGVI